jgi:hypothetical protein
MYRTLITNVATLCMITARYGQRIGSKQDRGIRSMAEYKVSSHALDVIFKLEAQTLAMALPRQLGLALPRIVQHFPTEVPRLDLRLQQLDSVFLLEDTSLLHLEFQAKYLYADLVRFAEYDLGLHLQHQRDVGTVIFYGPAVKRRPPLLHLRTLRFRPYIVLLGNRSGTQALRRLRAQVRSGLPLSEADRLDLMLLPLMRHQQPAEEMVQEAVTLARQLPQPEQARALGPILGLAYHYLGEAILNRLMEDLMATSTMREYFAEAIEQGLERGRVETRRTYIAHTLERRFGVVPSDLVQRLGAVADPAQLDVLFDAALSVARIDDFMALLPAGAQ